MILHAMVILWQIIQSNSLHQNYKTQSRSEMLRRLWLNLCWTYFILYLCPLDNTEGGQEAIKLLFLSPSLFMKGQRFCRILIKSLLFRPKQSQESCEQLKQIIPDPHQEVRLRLALSCAVYVKHLHVFHTLCHFSESNRISSSGSF